MNYLSLGLRNVWRNRRRSVVTLLAVAAGFASIAIFAGYVHNVFDGLTRQAIQGELLGHLTINKRGLETEGRIKPEKYLFTTDEVTKVEKIVGADAGVRLVTPRLSLSGIISNGRASTIFISEGVVPQDVATIKGDFQRQMAGDLDANNKIGVAIGVGLADILGIKKGDTASMLVSTLSGQQNALDVDIVDVFDTGNPNTRDKFVYMPLSLAQNLYDVDGQAERLIVLLDDTAKTDATRAQVADQLKAAGFDVEVRTWQDLSVFYRSVKGLFNMIFAFIFGIVMIVVVMSIVNAMSMTVVERTREIGALRAIGLRRRGVIRLFATEAAVLVGLGCLAGVFITLLVQLAVNHSGIMYVPPNSSNRVKLLVDLDIAKMALSFLVICTLGALSALLPARGPPGNRSSTRSGTSRPDTGDHSMLHPSLPPFGRRALLTLAAAGSLGRVARADPAADAIVRQSDLARGGGQSGISWTIRLVTSGNDDATDGERELAVRAVRTSSLAETLAPVRFRGTKLLQVERNMWLSRPGLQKPIPISPRQRLSGLAANGDIAATNYAADYEATLLREEALRGDPCFVFDLVARSRYTTYDRITYWISKQRRVAVQAQFLAVSGKLLKSASFEYGNTIKVGGQPAPFISKITISDSLTPAQTTMQYSGVTVQELSASLFDVDNL